MSCDKVEELTNVADLIVTKDKLYEINQKFLDELLEIPKAKQIDSELQKLMKKL